MLPDYLQYQIARDQLDHLADVLSRVNRGEYNYVLPPAMVNAARNGLIAWRNEATQALAAVQSRMEEVVMTDQSIKVIRTKWTCQSVRKYQVNNWQTDRTNSPEFHYEYEFNVVVDGTEENKLLFAATPTGSLKMSGLRGDLYEPGKSYYFDSTPA
jgi:hypothetical protein